MSPRKDLQRRSASRRVIMPQRLSEGTVDVMEGSGKRTICEFLLSSLKMLHFGGYKTATDLQLLKKAAKNILHNFDGIF